jgi:gas vesicle protein
MSDDNGNSFLWFLAGLGIGAAVGILYAPKPGDETRQRIREVAEESSGVVRERARQAREQAGGWVDKGRDYLNQQREQVRSAFDAGRQAYREATTEEGESAPKNP